VDPDPFVPNSVCNDGIDNDGGGAIDLADPGCRDANASLEDPQCDDGIDNDGEGGIDLADPGCNDESWRNLESPQCQDGVDNDADGGIDLADVDCAHSGDNREASGSCGLGAELALLLPPLAMARRRLRRLRSLQAEIPRGVVTSGLIGP